MYTSCFSLTAAAILLIAGEAFGSDGNDVTSETGPAHPELRIRSAVSGVEEFTVTARRRGERLLDSPVAVTAFGRTELDLLDIRRVQDISGSVPNLSFDASVGTSSAARIHLRGAGNGDPIASDDPRVGLYVDGVYLARAQGSLFSIFDVERIEVLRGPQGALFGKNSIGGAIHILTQRPTFDEMEGTAEIRAGNYGRFDTRISLNLPLVPERAAARLNLATRTRDGFTKNKGSGSDLDDDKLLAFRAQISVLPTDNSEIWLSADHSLEDRKPQGFKCKVANPYSFGQTAESRPDLAALGSEYRAAPAGAVLAQQVGIGDPDRQRANLLNGVNPYLRACAEDDARDARSVASDLSFQEEDLKTFGLNATYVWNVGANLTLRTISSWRRQELDQARDFDGTNHPLAALDSVDAGGEQQDQISQEIQLLGEALDGRLSYVAGLFYFQERATDRGYQGGANGETLLVPRVPGDFTTLTPQRSTFESTTLAIENSSWAVFGQGTYRFTNALSATLGLRATRERKRIKRADVCQGTGVDIVRICDRPGQVVFEFDGSSRFKDVSPVFTLQYAIGESANLYATWSRGFKSGGFNGRADTASLTDDFADEKLTSYELGFKSLFFDERLGLSGALFYSVYNDIQLSIPRGNPETAAVEVFVTNAARAEIQGAELEMRLTPFDGLELSSAFGFTDARYVSFSAPLSAFDPRIPDDPRDNALPNTPTYTWNVGATYGVPMGAAGDLGIHFDWTHIGRSGTDVNDSKLLRKGKHGELDARLSWMQADGKTEISLWSNNLLNREYVTNGIDLGASFGSALLIYNAPRTFGVEVRRAF